MTLSEAVAQAPSPCYLVDLNALESNCRTLASVQDRTGAKVLLALKGFAMFATFPLVRRYLKGTCASGVHEARLGHEEFSREVHAYAPAFSAEEFLEILPLIDHITVNSYRQWEKLKALLPEYPDVSAGFRVNPEYSEAPVAIYNPCAPGSRLGIRAVDLAGKNLEGITGIHFHTLCEQNSDALENTIHALEGKFRWYLERADVTWINMGGGHHITREDYDIDRLCRVIDRVSQRYGLQAYLEPGEAVGLNCGYLVTTVLDIVQNQMPIAILDISATAHMPDVLEMPYRPMIIGAGEPGEKAHTYKLGGMTCLAGDVIGDYSFERPLEIGQRLVFADMAHYTMVKTTTFNGVKLPSLVTYHREASCPEVVKQFAYEDYRNRLS